MKADRKTDEPTGGRKRREIERGRDAWPDRRRIALLRSYLHSSVGHSARLLTSRSGVRASSGAPCCREQGVVANSELKDRTWPRGARSSGAAWGHSARPTKKGWRCSLLRGARNSWPAKHLLVGPRASRRPEAFAQRRLLQRARGRRRNACPKTPPSPPTERRASGCRRHAARWRKNNCEILARVLGKRAAAARTLWPSG